MTSAPIAVSPDLLTKTPSAPHGRTREQIASASKDFEAQFLSIMMSQMFDGVGEGEFSGGQGEAMFKSFLMDAFSKQISHSGGISISGSVQREMLKLQGLE